MLKSRKNKMIAGIVSGCVALIAVIAIVNLMPDNREDAPIGETQPQTTAAPANTVSEPTTTRRNVTTLGTMPSTTAPESPDVLGNEPGVEITLAPVEVPNTRVSSILEERDVQVTPPRATQTSPPQEEQRSPSATTYIDGRLHTWNPVLGWVSSTGDSGVIIMDVESDGEMYEGGW
jgi:hypothetical protein